MINKYEGIIYPSEKVDWKNIEKNNLTIALNVAYAEKEKVYQNREKKMGKQIIFLMIWNWQGWHYLAVKKYQRYQEL